MGEFVEFYDGEYPHGMLGYRSSDGVKVFWKGFVKPPDRVTCYTVYCSDIVIVPETQQAQTCLEISATRFRISSFVRCGSLMTR